MVYVATFLSSMLFGYWATRINPKTNRWLVFLCSLLSILIPSILAGVRDVSIGTDVELYLVTHFDIALKAETFSQYITMIWEKEFGYMLLVYIVAKLFGDIQCLMFFIELIIMVCVYIGAWRFRKELSLPFVLLLFFLIFYNDTYNLIRQAIAMAIVFMAVPWLFEKKYFKYFLLVFIAITFHMTAVIALVVFFMHWFLNGRYMRGDSKAKTLRGYALVGCVLIGCLLFPYLVEFLVSSGVLHSRYMVYITHESLSNNATNTLIYLIELIVVISCSKYLELKDKEFAFSKINLFFLFITLQLANTIYYGYRMSLYFALINILLIARIPQISNNYRTKILLSSIITVVFVAFWLYLYVISGVSNTYPYLPYWN